MKALLLIFSIFVSSATLAASQKVTATLNITKLAYGGFWLATGWKFFAGDSPAFARPGFNDDNWQTIYPTNSIPKLPAQAIQGIGWMRIKLHVSEEVWKNASLRVINVPAIEIYLDGQLIGKRGTIDAQHKTTRGYFDHLDPVALPATGKTDHIIAIRYCMQPGFNFLNWNNFSGGFVSIAFLATSDFTAIKQHFWYFQISDMVSASVLFLLALFHFTLYRYNRKKDGNLFFAGYALCFGLYMVIEFKDNFDNYIDVFMLFTTLGNILAVASLMLCLKALFTLFNFSTGGFFGGLAITSAILMVAWIFIQGMPPFIGFGLLIFILSVDFWLTIKAVWYKKRGANIIATGFFAGLFCVIVYLLTNTGLINIPFFLFILTSSVTVFGPVLAISIYLGREFALDGLLLQAKLAQVEQLSAKTIAQEQEKQALLAEQNDLLEQQVKERTADLHQSLTNLKATQTQLIQSEKMASLGELTAGIAHEIQNPLNFVNNFSEVNREMIDELKEELKSGNTDEALAIVDDIKQNEEKITHHGKRADAIVKGMLEHSRVSSGQKELTDINALADEYLRLSYHGLRAKDKSFNAEMVTSFDNKLPKINVIPQDIGRVFLNLFNNAFYEVNQKQKTRGGDYKPQVSLITSVENDMLVIKVKDNGIGIPVAIKEKIMQPFFTTKPTGEGTGLGLSLTYDMVVKRHGGSIQVNSVEGEGSEFIIQLPVR